MSKEFYDKYGKLVGCFSCNCIEPCSKSDSPICSEGYVFFAKDKIANIEAKLAEKEEELLQKEKKIEDLMLCEFVSTALDFNKLSADNCRLREQLAEKEKENTKLKEVVDCVDKLKQFNADMNDYALVNKYVADEIYCEHQDKISFAVEQLEKVKELILKKCFEASGKGVVIRYYDVYHIFDNQIKRLKEMK